MTSTDSTDSFAGLVSIIARLRGPDGCPWDRKQTHVSLRENLLSECYEALAALDEGDASRLCEELGDLLLQVVLHAQIGREVGEFTIDDVVRGISSKLIRRHPHVFGSKEAGDAQEVLRLWEVLKEGEREAGKSMLDGVPASMPALGYSLEVQNRAARVGFDWSRVDDIVDKLVEEIAELRQADTPEQRSREFGDLLFTLVNIARRLGIDAEAALRQTNRRFYRRFSRMEELGRSRGLRLRELTLPEQDALWEEVKKLEPEG